MLKRLHPIRLSRVYDELGEISGARVLVDRLWPRGLSKERLQLDDWIKDVAPSEDLRKWFAHEPTKWAGFRERYFVELDQNPEAVGECVSWCAKGPVVLLFAAKDIEHNNAGALREYLIVRLQKDSRSNAT
ncbi:MAG: hypothetical protein APF80_09975 [Alphaproteobacteria bacterium BRH_c36]|nr:MAG: hypothetical protein APF80_09975 [Alphaproteobacteria bacterium BRH_c36]